MSFDYSELVSDAQSILAEFGGDVTRRAFTDGAYDDSTATVTQTSADTTRKGVFLPFAAGLTTVRGELVQAHDKQLLLDATAACAATDRYVDAAGVVYSVVSLVEIKPASVAVLYDMHVRKA